MHFTTTAWIFHVGFLKVKVQIIFAKNKDSSSTKKCCPLVTRGKFKVWNFVCYKVWFLWKRKLIVFMQSWEVSKCSCKLTVSFSVLVFFLWTRSSRREKEYLKKYWSYVWFWRRKFRFGMKIVTPLQIPRHKFLKNNLGFHPSTGEDLPSPSSLHHHCS